MQVIKALNTTYDPGEDLLPADFATNVLSDTWIITETLEEAISLEHALQDIGIHNACDNGLPLPPSEDVINMLHELHLSWHTLYTAHVMRLGTDIVRVPELNEEFRFNDNIYRRVA